MQTGFNTVVYPTVSHSPATQVPRKRLDTGGRYKCVDTFLMFADTSASGLSSSQTPPSNYCSSASREKVVVSTGVLPRGESDVGVLEVDLPVVEHQEG